MSSVIIEIKNKYANIKEGIKKPLMTSCKKYLRNNVKVETNTKNP